MYRRCFMQTTTSAANLGGSGFSLIDLLPCPTILLPNPLSRALSASRRKSFQS